MHIIQRTLHIAAILAAMTAVSCMQKETLIDKSGEKLSALCTGATKSAVNTRVPDTFTAWGYYYEGTFSDGCKPNLMLNETFSRVSGDRFESTHRFTTIDSRYSSRIYGIWPGKAKGLTLSGKNDGGAPHFTYTLPSDAGDQRDIIAAKSQDYTGTPQDFSLQFTHVLTNVRVKTSDDNEAGGIVAAIRICGVRSAGKYTIGEGWTDVGDSDTADFTSSPGITAGSSAKYLTEGDNVLQMIPQTCPQGARLEVDLQRTSGNATASFPIGGMPLLPATNVTFEIKMESDETEATVTVQPQEWDDNDISEQFPGNGASIQGTISEWDGHGNTNAILNCLKFTSTSQTIAIENNGSNAPDVQYSLDGVNWSALTSTPIAFSGNIYVRGMNTSGFSTSNANYTRFVFDDSLEDVNVSGSVMSLIDYQEEVDTIPCNYCFYKLFNGAKKLDAMGFELPATTLAAACYRNMFYGCTSVTTVPTLPATQLAASCYQSMFYNCTSLTTASELPATQLAASCYQSMFYGCSQLAAAPALPATELANSCYKAMFYNCSQLTSAPDLPATELTQSCYHYMFYGCTNLTTAPALPATKLTDSCYEHMFNTCSSLISAPDLPATQLADSCYRYMFYGCSQLTSAPALPVTKLANNCYERMFQNCSGLTSAPDLPATELTDYCYHSMFSGCSGITTAPDLPAATLVNNCYCGMFQNCSQLNFIRMLATDISATNCMANWVPGVSPTGTFVKAKEQTNLTRGTSGIPVGWNLEDYVNLSLKFTSTNQTIAIENNGTNNPNVEYSTDKTIWQTLTTTPVAFSGDLYVRGKNTSGFSTSNANYTRFVFDNSLDDVNVSGSVMSLIDYQEEVDTIPCNYCFYKLFNGAKKLDAIGLELPATQLASSCYRSMFNGCIALTTAPALSATQLADYCCYAMFNGCTALTTAPALPATELATYCYGGMFYGCTALTTAPTLSATKLANYCCYSMFNGCTALTTAPALPATQLATYCYQYMFSGCAALTTAPALPATQLADYCYGDMFYNCTALTTVPALSATKLANNCCYEMFRGCIALTTAPALPATQLAQNCYTRMFRGCAALTTAPTLSATQLADYCCYEMFRSCAALTTAPDLPATQLAASCYQSMFYSCAALTTAPDLPATQLAAYCYQSMFYGCTNLTTAPDLPATQLADYCYSSMFNDCSGITTAPDLPAATLVNNCYCGMFQNCSQLNFIRMLATDISATDCLLNWVSGVASSGTFVKAKEQTNLTRGTSGIPVGWNLEDYGVTSTSLKFTSTNQTIALKNKGSNNPNVEYSTDNTTWQTLGTTPIAFSGDLYVRGMNTSGFSTSSVNYTRFVFDDTLDDVNVSGNVMSLINYQTDVDTIPCAQCFIGLFLDAKKLDASGFELPAMTLADNCYISMFEGCTSLETPPELPAMTLADNCYICMFEDCTSLETPPELPATVLKSGCYEKMFAGCTSLTTAPDLPATYLVSYGYEYMFYGCSNLSSVKMLAINLNSGNNHLYGWLYGVAASGTLTINANAQDGFKYTIKNDTNNGAPTGWTIVEE